PGPRSSRRIRASHDRRKRFRQRRSRFHFAETSSSGFTINLLFDAAAMAAPASFRTGIEQAASILSATVTNKITVNIDIDYSGTGGGAFAGPTTGEFVNYS